MTDTDREARLPAWARAEIASLRRRAEDAERDRDKARLATEPNLSNTLIEPYSDIPIGLGMGTSIRFLVGDAQREEYADVRVDHDHKGRPFMHIMGGTTLRLVPRSTNVLDLTVSHE